MPFFSIITIARNNLNGLKATEASITSQTCKDYEWIIIDGASTDGTGDFLTSTNAHITSEPDTGIYNAMNKGIDKAAGTYLLFLNAGDQLAAPNTLQTIKSAANNEEFIYGDAMENGRYKKARHHKNIKHHMFTHHQSMLYRRDKVEQLRYNETYKIAADYDFTARFLMHNTSARYTNTPLCIFEPGGISQTNAKTGRQEQFQIRKELKLTSLPINIKVYIMQKIMWSMRRFLKPLYWWWKTRFLNQTHNKSYS